LRAETIAIWRNAGIIADVRIGISRLMTLDKQARSIGFHL
jgi:hypothetical protein